MMLIPSALSVSSSLFLIDHQSHFARRFSSSRPTETSSALELYLQFSLNRCFTLRLCRMKVFKLYGKCSVNSVRFTKGLSDLVFHFLPFFRLNLSRDAFFFHPFDFPRVLPSTNRFIFLYLSVVLSRFSTIVHRQLREMRGALIDWR